MKPTLSRIEEGMVLGGDYKIERASDERLELGAGAMGAVYRATDLRLQRKVVIKTIQMELIEGEHARRAWLERFLRESVLAGGCRDPAIVTLYRASEPDETGFAWYAMEAVEGAVDLGKWLAEHGNSKAPFAEIARFLEDAARALREIHGHGIIHRDLKLTNFLVCPTPEGPRLKLFDFGIAHVPDSGLTKTMQVIGTPAYVSPERARAYIGGERHVYGRGDDLYALGVVAYVLITGHKPFDAHDDLDMIRAVVHEQPKDVLDHRPDTPVGLQHITMRLLEKRPEDRFADAQALLDALRGMDALPRFMPTPNDVASRAVCKDAPTKPFATLLDERSSIHAGEVFGAKEPLEGAAADFAEIKPPETGFHALPKRTRWSLIGGALIVVAFFLIVLFSLGDKEKPEEKAPLFDADALAVKPEMVTPEDMLRLQNKAREDKLLQEDRERRAEAVMVAAPTPMELESPAPQTKSVVLRSRHADAPVVGTTPAAQPASPAPPIRKNLAGMIASVPSDGPTGAAGAQAKLGIVIDTKVQARLSSALTSEAPSTLVTAVLDRAHKGPGMTAPLPVGTKFFGRAEYRFGTQRVEIAFNKLQLPGAGKTYEINAIVIEPNGQAGLIATVIKRDERAKANTGEAAVDVVEGLLGDSPGSRAAGRFTDDKRDDARELRAGNTILALPINKKIQIQFVREL